jgi:hypothetical protein
MKRTFFLIGVLALAGLAVLPASAGVVYNNDFGGVTSGDNFNTDAWTTNFGFSVTNSFVLASNTNLTGANFAIWTNGYTLSSVNWYITTAEFGGTTLASGTASPTGSTIATNSSGYTILNEAFNIPSLALNGATTYWFQLDTANSVPSGNPIYWDQSDGPSTAYESSIGPLLNNSPCLGLCTGSESFELLSSGTPEPGTVTLLGGGLLAMAAFLRRKKKA